MWYLKKSAKEAWDCKIWGLLIFVLSLITTITGLGKDLFGSSAKDSIIFSALITIAFFTLFFLIFLARNTIRYIHNSFVDSIWGKAIIDLKDAYAEIHALRKKGEITDDEFMSAMITFCDTLKKIFDRKTKSDCCVSIKVLLRGDTDNSRVINLCRDSQHHERDTEIYKKTSHTVIGNTPYRFIYANLKNHKKPYSYVNNDIEHTRDYQNTSKPSYKNEILPYKSELVYPIIPIKSTEAEDYALCGFVCVDCDKKDKFDETRYDIPMIEGIADGIYDIIKSRTH